MRSTDELLSLPNVSWAAEALELVLDVESRAMANHSVRSWAFARLLAEHEDMTHDVDDALLFAATVLHDTGLRHDARAPVRFEVDGADYAAEFLTARQVPAGDVDRVWEAIALHTSPGIAERRGPLAYLVREGIGIDFGRRPECVSEAQAAAIHEAYPRLSFITSIVDEIVAQCREVPERGPRYSIAGELTRERSTPPHLTQMEQAAPSLRWGAS
jgi:HD domain